MALHTDSFLAFATKHSSLQNGTIRSGFAFGLTELEPAQTTISGELNSELTVPANGTSSATS